MPPTLIVEDGSIVPNANSYETVASVRAYATDRGVTLDVSDDVVKTQLVKATDFLESFATQYVGSVVSFDQPLSWPRKGVQFDPSTPFPDDEIPIVLIQAQSEAVIALSQGIDLQPNVDYSQGGFVIMEKVGPIETRFSDSVGTTSAPQLPKVMAKLELLFGGVQSALTVVRV